MKRILRQFKFPWKPLQFGLAALAMASGPATSARAQNQHYKVFLNMSYSGNIWQAAAGNGIKALAETPPYDKEVEFKTVISGTDVQRQISDLQSMIAAGANAILIYPLSPTALNRVIRQPASRKFSCSPTTVRSLSLVPIT